MQQLIDFAQDWQALLGMAGGAVLVIWRLGVKGGSVTAQLEAMTGWLRRVESRVEQEVRGVRGEIGEVRDLADRTAKSVAYLRGRMEGMPPEAAARAAEERR